MDEQRVSQYLDQLWQMFLAEDFEWSLDMMDLSDQIAGHEPVSGLLR